MPNQATPRPNGVTVFGSYLVRVAPDRALVSFRVTRTQANAAVAFEQTRAAAQSVRSALAAAKLVDADIRTSQILLHTAVEGYGANAKVIGQCANIAFTVALRELAQLEDVLLRVVEAGADRIDGVSFHTSRIAQVRADARRGAVMAATRKAQLYATAAGATLGKVIHIEDVDPTLLNRRGHAEDLSVSFAADDGEDAELAEGPGMITIGAAVTLTFAIT
jgi:uncharacterized protein YggE